MSKRSDARAPRSSQPDPSSPQRLSKRPPVSTSEYPDSKRISLAKDKERPARGSPVAGTAHYHSPKSPQKPHIVLPPPPGPPPPTAEFPDAESPTKGPVTPVSGQVHQRPFAATMAHHTPSSPAPPSPSHGQDAMASSHQHFANPSSPTHHPSPSRMAAASYPHPPPSPPPHPAASYPHPPLSPPPHPAAYTAGHPPAAYVPGSFVAGVPFDSFPLHHQNFILKTATHCWKDQYTDLQQDNYRLKTATHCWKDQYADLQQDNARLRAHIASGEERRESLEDRVQLLEMRLHMQEGGNSRTASG